LQLDRRAVLEQACAGSDDEREDQQPELVDEVVRDQRLGDAGTADDDEILGRLPRGYLREKLAKGPR
jgi:hypothetical protein